MVQLKETTQGVKVWAKDLMEGGFYRNDLK